MGRGLSELQRWVLRKAADADAGRLHYAEILVGFFGWVPENSLYRSQAFGAHAGEFDKGNHFTPGRIGHKRYRSDKASLSRACARLGQRGLVTCWKGVCRWAAVEITDKGREWLSANKVPNGDLVNQ